uniref:Structural polyprotein n=2 Tax=Ross River virus TaxID=11029 RepID=A0A5P8KY93_9VIRU|nr:structural polyprotein [Ross River virus]QFR08086.1 structural polyprotein [Ross River virus]QFR08228.1 structural polyprotein [Ross River virus]
MNYIPTQTFYGRRWRPRPAFRPWQVPMQPTPTMAAPMLQAPDLQAQQMQQLISAVSALTTKQNVKAPKGQRKKKQQKPKEKKENQKKKPTQKKKQQQKPKPQAKKKKPGRRERMCMKIENDCIFEVKLDGKVTGYACLVGDKVMKPAHVKGTIDNPDLAKLTYKKSSKYDLECAQIPVHMKSDASKYTHEKPEGHYNWHHGAVQYSGGRFTIPTGAGKPGDSGRPIFDNKGRVVAIVLGGANEGARTALSVVTWTKDMVTRVTPEGTEEWSAALMMCILANTSFPCSSPPCYPCCYEKQPEQTLRMLEDNVNRPGYYELLEASMTCRNGSRHRRSVTEHFNVYKATRPYLAHCADCGDGYFCYSPVAIEKIRDEASDGMLKIQVSAQIGLDKAGTHAHTKLRYMAGHDVQESKRDSLRVYTSAACSIRGTMGHFIVAHCPPGDYLKVSFEDADSHVKACKVQYKHNPLPVGREKFVVRPHFGVELPCTSYQLTTAPTDEEIDMHTPPDIPDRTLLSQTAGNVKITAGGRTIRYNCTCGRDNVGTTSTDKIINTCKIDQCHAAVTSHDKWQFTSPFVPRADQTARKGKVHVPFPLTNVTCRVPLARAPDVTDGKKEVTLRLHPDHPTLFSYRSLGAEPHPYEEWVDKFSERIIPVTEEGIEYQWGNNPPVRLWAQLTTEGKPHGWPHEIIQYYYGLYPAATIAAVSGASLMALLTLAATCCMLATARRKCLTPYALTPGAVVPLTLGLLCCAPRANAASFAETMAYLWDENKTLFWMEFAAPAAALALLACCIKSLICCCKPISFLVLLSLGASVKAYEHTATIPNVVGFPYKAHIERNGFSPMTLQLEVVETSLEPTLNLEYITCEYKTVVPSPFIKCCGTSECSSKEQPDYQCKVYTGVYPFMWGGAYCFCDSENTQLSEAYVDRSDICKHDHALAYKAHTASLKATIRISYGTINQTTEAFVNGEHAVNVGGSKFIFGPISTAWSPFDNKIVVYKDDVYNQDFPPYGSGQPGRFGDIQSRTVESKDLYANTALKLSRPSPGVVHVPYTQTPSGFKYWLKEKGSSLNTKAPFGCKIKTNPVRAMDCAVGSIPVSMDIPDSAFTRVVDAPAVTDLSCQVAVCTHSSDFGGVATLSYKTDKPGKCAVHSHSNVATLQEATVDVKEDGKVTVHFSTASASPAFKVSVCDAKTTCTAACEPPKDHIVPYGASHNNQVFPDMSGTAMTWVQRMASGLGGLALIAVLVLVLVTCITMRR